MKVVEIRALAVERGVQAGKMNKGDLIRTLQKEEGNEACFASGKVQECGQAACLWREDCH